MASKFPPFLRAGNQESSVVQFKVAAAATFKAGALVVYSTTTDDIDEVGADPALILGLALADAASKTIYPGSKIPVLVIDPSLVVGLSSATTPLESHVLDAGFGIEKTTYWRIDITDTTNIRVQVLEVDIPNGVFYCRFVAANLQGDLIAS